jgi:hypothetical protein
MHFTPDRIPLPVKKICRALNPEGRAGLVIKMQAVQSHFLATAAAPHTGKGKQVMALFMSSAVD